MVGSRDINRTYATLVSDAKKNVTNFYPVRKKLAGIKSAG